MFDVTEALESICGPDDRREAVATLLDDSGVSYQRTEHPGGAINFVISFGSDWAWDTVYGAHYDRVPQAPGANDNGASIVCLIRLAAQLTQAKYEGPLAIVLFDKEEPCHRGIDSAGSYQFGLELAKRKHQPGLFVVLDVIGFGDTMIYDPRSCKGMAGVIAPIVPGLQRKGTPGSDDVLLKGAGIEAVLLCVLPREEVKEYPMTWSLLHTAGDSVETVDPDTVDWVQRVLHEALQEAPVAVQGVPLYKTVEESYAWNGEPWTD